MKKEELQIKVGELKNKLEWKEKENERIRKEFAKAFNWRDEAIYYNGSKEYIIPTWEQIFIQIGKLLKS